MHELCVLTLHFILMLISRLLSCQGVFGARSTVRDQHRWKNHGESSAGPEGAIALYLRRRIGARLHAAAEERLLSTLHPLGTLQESLGERHSAFPEEKVFRLRRPGQEEGFHNDGSKSRSSHTGRSREGARMITNVD